MTLDAYARLVAELRSAQERWIAHRDSDDLRRCRELERQVDRETRKIRDGTPDLPGMEDTS